MSEPAIKYEVETKPCPFCGSTDLTDGTLYIDDEGTELVPAGDVGEIDTVHCRSCLAEAPAIVWNRNTQPAQG